MNEHLTRKEIIDSRLKQAGWNVSDRTQVIEEFDIIINPDLAQEAKTPYSGHQFSDYVLVGKDGKPLAVVEAKKTSVDAAIGREQAKQYCPPPIEIQIQFAQIVEKNESLKAQYQSSLRELENLYGSLSQRAFKGD